MIDTSVHNHIKTLCLFLNSNGILETSSLQPFHLNSVLIVYFLCQMRTLQPVIRSEFDITSNPSFTCQLLTKLSNVHTDEEEQQVFVYPCVRINEQFFWHKINNLQTGCFQLACNSGKCVQVNNARISRYQWRFAHFMYWKYTYIK